MTGEEAMEGRASGGRENDNRGRKRRECGDRQILLVDSDCRSRLRASIDRTRDC